MVSADIVSCQVMREFRDGGYNTLVYGKWAWLAGRSLAVDGGRSQHACPAV